MWILNYCSIFHSSFSLTKTHPISDPASSPLYFFSTSYSVRLFRSPVSHEPELFNMQILFLCIFITQDLLRKILRITLFFVPMQKPQYHFTVYPWLPYMMLTQAREAMNQLLYLQYAWNPVLTFTFGSLNCYWHLSVCGLLTPARSNRERLQKCSVNIITLYCKLTSILIWELGAVFSRSFISKSDNDFHLERQHKPNHCFLAFLSLWLR